MVHRQRWWIKSLVWDEDRRDVYCGDQFLGDVYCDGSGYGHYGNPDFRDPYFAELRVPGFLQCEDTYVSSAAAREWAGTFARALRQWLAGQGPSGEVAVDAHQRLRDRAAAKLWLVGLYLRKLELLNPYEGMAPSGRLLLVYGHRQFPFGAQAIASKEQGAAWDTAHPIIRVWFSWDCCCGHPRSILMPDGTVMTGYYARVLRGDNRNQDIVSHALR